MAQLPCGKVASHQMDSLPKCHLLTIPGELRNHIYTHVFAPENEQVDLIEARPPAKDVLLCCKQMYEEAKELYQAAYRRFWSESIFIARNDHPGAMTALRTALSVIRDTEIAAMQYVHVYGWEARWVLHENTWYSGTRRGGLHAWLVVPRDAQATVQRDLPRQHFCCRECNIVWATTMSAAEKKEALAKIGRGPGLSRYELEVMINFERKRDPVY